MARRSIVLSVAAAAGLAACNAGSGKSGPVVASGNGVTITAPEFKARLDEQSPFIRQRFTTLDRKKEFLQNLVQFELLASEAQKAGMEKDPDVQYLVKRAMVQKYLQRKFADTEGAKNIPDAELQKFYGEHKDDYQKPARLRLAVIVVKGDAAKAKKVAATVKEQEKKNPLAFAAAARESSQDEATRNIGGDLGYKSKDELEKAYGKAFADVVAPLKDGEEAGPVETSQGFVVAKVTGHQEEINRPFDQVKPQIASRLWSEKKKKEFDDFTKQLKDQANVKVNDAELEKVEVAAAPAGMPGMMPGMMGGGHGGMAPGGQMGGAPGAHQAPPAPATSPAK
ncbi:MAG TPA: peptidyl-prolyl cis-trans isomerase [Anaeromyxobacteraceae bacterium]|jgi:peptidyl-prolyl cis-trans isomerase C|nr:peptidyl-prolyl cis-trans isomerase [Anaeromyxobacteraceae bacterium]